MFFITHFAYSEFSFCTWTVLKNLKIKYMNNASQITKVTWSEYNYLNFYIVMIFWLFFFCCYTHDILTQWVNDWNLNHTQAAIYAQARQSIWKSLTNSKVKSHHFCTLLRPSKSAGKMLILFMVSISSRRSGWICTSDSSVALVSNTQSQVHNYAWMSDQQQDQQKELISVWKMSATTMTWTTYANSRLACK